MSKYITLNGETYKRIDDIEGEEDKSEYYNVAYVDNVKEEKQVIAVDIDGFIAEGKFWKEDCIPKKDVIEKVNQLYKQGNIIIYHTARHPSYYQKTYAWLIKQGCYFHALEMGKLTADIYLDDRNGDLDKILKNQN